MDRKRFKTMVPTVESDLWLHQGTRLAHSWQGGFFYDEKKKVRKWRNRTKWQRNGKGQNGFLETVRRLHNSLSFSVSKIHPKGLEPLTF